MMRLQPLITCDHWSMIIIIIIDCIKIIFDNDDGFLSMNYINLEKRQLIDI